MDNFRIGDIKKGYEIGKTAIYDNFIWHECPFCGATRWVTYTKGKPVSNRCNKCAMKEVNDQKRYKNSINWKDNRHQTKDGYILLRLKDDNPYYKMAQTRDNYVMEHRLVMAKHIGRCLTKKENVHHKNGIKNDNRIENLELTGSISEHIKAHSKGYQDGYTKGLIDGQNKQIQELKLLIEEQTKQIKLLQWQTKISKESNTVSQ